MDNDREWFVKALSTFASENFLGFMDFITDYGYDIEEDAASKLLEKVESFGC